MQVPWRALGSQPVVVELTDVWLVAGPWEEAEWEEGPAARRGRLAKEARLVAADLARRAGAGSEREQRGAARSFLSHLATLLLNRLQLRVRGVHLSFQVRPTPVATAARERVVEWGTACAEQGSWHRNSAGLATRNPGELAGGRRGSFWAWRHKQRAPGVLTLANRSSCAGISQSLS